MAAVIEAVIQNQSAQMRLGLSQVASCKFTGNGITTMNRLRTLTEDALNRLIKQILEPNQGTGLFILSNIFKQHSSGLTVYISWVQPMILLTSANH
jgi:hypothetical protein